MRIQYLAVIANKPGNEPLRTKLIQKLVHKIQITPDGFTIHYRVGRDYIEGELAKTATSKLFLVSGSNSLTDGGCHRARTCDLCRVKATL